MTYPEFVMYNEKSKEFVAATMEIIVVDFAEGNCVVRTENDEMQTIPIEELAESVVYGGQYTLKNPSALEYWKGMSEL